MNHPAHSSSHHSSHAAAYCPLCFPSLVLHFICHCPYFLFTSHQLLHSTSSKLSPLAFVSIYSTPLFCRHCSSIDLYIPCDLDLSTGFLIFSLSWLACVDGIYLLVYAARGASHQSHSSIYIIIYTCMKCGLPRRRCVPVRRLFQISRDCTWTPSFCTHVSLEVWSNTVACYAPHFRLVIHCNNNVSIVQRPNCRNHWCRWWTRESVSNLFVSCLGYDRNEWGRYSLLFASRGANVVVNDFNAEAAQKVVDEIKKGVLVRSLVPARM